MQKITTHLWFDKEAKEAAEFYTSVFPGAKIKSSTVINDTPSGSVDIVVIELEDQEIHMISAGPIFKLNPSISYMVECQTKEEVEQLWAKLSEGGTPLMPLGTYPFSEKYGWTNDKFGVSWQLVYMGGREIDQKITPSLLFVGDVAGKAEEAINFYASIFDNSEVLNDQISRYGANQEPDVEGTVNYAPFKLFGQKFIAMDSAHAHKFQFNEALSLIVHCETQEEIDKYWEKLSAVPEAEQCGWLKDKYGVSWQIVPTAMDEMMKNGTREQIDRVTQAFLPMKKFDLAKLKEAYEG